MENHPSQNRKLNSLNFCFAFDLLTLATLGDNALIGLVVFVLSHKVAKPLYLSWLPRAVMRVFLWREPFLPKHKMLFGFLII